MILYDGAEGARGRGSGRATATHLGGRAAADKREFVLNPCGGARGPRRVQAGAGGGSQSARRTTQNENKRSVSKWVVCTRRRASLRGKGCVPFMMVVEPSVHSAVAGLRVLEPLAHVAV
eukprot:2894046-Prymnesium_polylepis.1